MIAWQILRHATRRCTVKTDRHAIYYRLNRQTKAKIKATLDGVAIGNEGKE